MKKVHLEGSSCSSPGKDKVWTDSLAEATCRFCVMTRIRHLRERRGGYRDDENDRRPLAVKLHEARARLEELRSGA